MKLREEIRSKIKGNRFIFAFTGRRGDKKSRENKTVSFFLITSVCLFLLFSGQMSQASSPSSTVGEAKEVAAGITPEKLKADLDFLFKTIEEVHPNMYAYVSKEEFAKHRDKLYAQINRPMGTIEFYKAIAPVVAKLKNGHTFVYPCVKSFSEYAKKGGKVCPLEISFDGQTARVMENNGLSDIPKGATILTIREEPAAQALGRISRRMPAELKDHNESILGHSDLFPVLMWIEFGDIASLPLRVKYPDGTVAEHSVNFVPISDVKKAQAKRLGSRVNYSFRLIAGDKVGLLEFNSFRNLEKFRKFLKETFEKIHKHRIKNLIIDLRKNPGGNSQLGDALLGYLTDKPTQQFKDVRIKISPQLRKRQPGLAKHLEKILDEPVIDGKLITIKGGGGTGAWRNNSPKYKDRIFVLIGPVTASSSIALACTIRALGIGTLIGRETSDTTASYGDCLNFTLSNSRLKFLVACKYFVDFGAPSDGGPLRPDHDVKENPEDIARGIDTVLEFALKLIRGNVRPGSISPR